MRNLLVFLCVLATLAGGCAETVWRGSVQPVQDAPATNTEMAPFLSLHLADGSVIVLDSWMIDVDAGKANGHGVMYDAARNEVDEGYLTIALADVVVAETNRPEEIPTNVGAVFGFVGLGILMLGGLGLLFGVGGVHGGSCPTVYAKVEGEWTLVGESFSEGIAKVLEQTDDDALIGVRSALGDGQERVELRVVNEFYETHHIRSLDLIALEVPDGAAAMRTAEGFLSISAPVGPTECTSEFRNTRAFPPTTDCTTALTSTDGHEYLSPASDTDLSEREAVHLSFARPNAASVGVAITARSSVMHSFLFASTLGHMGTQMAKLYAKFESSGPTGGAFARGMGKLLGYIDVEVQDVHGDWVHAGTFDHVGPIALDEFVVTIPAEIDLGDTLNIRISMARGHFKLDRVNVVHIGAPIKETVIAPSHVRSRIAQTETTFDNADALAWLNDEEEYLVTMPGDVHALTYEMPQAREGMHHEFQLRSTGYYYEWMREQWLPSEDLDRFYETMTSPGRALQRFAPEYKSVERIADLVFFSTFVPGVGPELLDGGGVH